MSNKDECINVINYFLEKSDNKELLKNTPVSKDDLVDNDVLCDEIIDYLSDIHMVIGFDENYNETDIGESISRAIDFIILTSELIE